MKLIFKNGKINEVKKELEMKISPTSTLKLKWFEMAAYLKSKSGKRYFYKSQ